MTARLLPWLAGILLVIGVSALGPWLDGVDDHSYEWAQADDLQAAINQAREQQRFAQAAQKACGPQARWEQLVDGSVMCRTRYGKPTITVQVSP